MKHDAEWARQAQRELRVLLNNCDPIGVFDPEDTSGEAGPVDEYDCIRDPLISRLLRGDDRAEVASLLRQELTDYFGLEPWLVTTDVIDRIFAWWAPAVSDPGHPNLGSCGNPRAARVELAHVALHPLHLHAALVRLALSLGKPRAPDTRNRSAYCDRLGQGNCAGRPKGTRQPDPGARNGQPP